MKKFLIICLSLIVPIVFISCGSESKSEVPNSTDEIKTISNQETDKKIEAPAPEELKKEAIEVNYMELKENPEINKNKKVFINGYVSVVLEGSRFTFTKKNGDDYETYSVTNLSDTKELRQNENIKLYGIYTGNDTAGFPLITAYIIEKDETKIEDTKDSESENTSIEQKDDRKLGIETSIRDKFNSGDYTNAKLNSITINENLGTDTSDDYIALVYLKFDIKNSRETGNEVMKMYSNDLVAKLANEGITDISEVAVFWEDEYNNRSVKYAYEYKNDGFYIMDIAGE